MEVLPFGTKDIIRIVITLVVVLFVGIFVAPNAPWILYLSIAVLFYTLFLEFVKYYLGLIQLRQKKFYMPPSYHQRI